MEQRKLNDQANTLVDFAKVSSPFDLLIYLNMNMNLHAVGKSSCVHFTCKYVNVKDPRKFFDPSEVHF